MQQSIYLALYQTKLNTTSVTKFTVMPVRCFLGQKHRIRLLQCRKRKSCQHTTSEVPY